jgi:hypothetical protein
VSLVRVQSPRPSTRYRRNTVDTKGVSGGSCRRASGRQAGAAAPKTRTPGSAAVVEGHLVAVGVRERESAAERPIDGR